MLGAEKGNPIDFFITQIAFYKFSIPFFLFICRWHSYTVTTLIQQLRMLLTEIVTSNKKREEGNWKKDSLKFLFRSHFNSLILLWSAFHVLFTISRWSCDIIIIIFFMSIQHVRRVDRLALLFSCTRLITSSSSSHHILFLTRFCPLILLVCSLHFSSITQHMMILDETTRHKF